MNAAEARAVLGQLKDHGRVRRWFGLGARAEELFDTFAKINELDDWCGEFGKVGKRFEESADATADKQVKVANYLSAAAYYHIGLLGTFEDNDIRKGAYRSVVRVYDKARGHFRIPAERVEYPFGGLTFSAYFRQAPATSKPPCVILLRGLDAAREIELHTISNFLLEKELSTLAIDTAGQGETRFQGMKLLPDVTESISAAVDYLEQRAGNRRQEIGDRRAKLRGLHRRASGGAREEIQGLRVSRQLLQPRGLRNHSHAQA